MTNYSELAGKYYDCFDKTRRHDKTIVVLKHPISPLCERVAEVVRNLEESMSDDSAYAFTRDGLADFHDNDLGEDPEENIREWADNDVDVYTSDLTDWLAESDKNAQYLSDVISEYGEGIKDNPIGAAQLMAREEAYNKVYELLKSENEEEKDPHHFEER